MHAKKALKYFILWPLVALLALGIILRLSLLPLAELGVNYWFEQQGIESDIAEMTLNLRDGQFSLSGLKAKANASPVLQIDQLDFGWSWQTLMQNEVDLLSISIDGVSFNIDTETDGNMVIAGIDLAKLSAANELDPEPIESGEDSPLQWLIRLHQFGLSDVNVCYRALPAMNYCSHVDNLDWNGLVSFDLSRLEDPTLPLEVEGNFNLTGVKLDNQIDKAVHGFKNLHIEFRQTASPSENDDKAITASDAIISLTGMKAEVNHSQPLSLDEIVIETSWSALLENKLKLMSVAVDGLSLDIESDAKGNLVIAGIDLANFSAAGDEGTETTASAKTSPLQWSLQLQRFEISNFNTCYRALPALDYCNQFKKLDWNGLVSLDLADFEAPALPLRVEGDFGLSGVKLHNNQLDRSLLKLDNLAIKAVRIDTLDNISSESVLLEKLQLLERRAKAMPAEMTSLEQLQISKFKLGGLNNIEISEISLLNHELLLATGADKKMEWKEWSVENTTTDKSGDTETTTEQPSEPIEFAVGKLTYQTNKSILYKDNSSDQPLTIDINNIELVLQNLDSKKPGQDSDIEFSGKLGKNGLITLKGKAKPLQEKVSFDLVGKITRIDLRSFSPLAHEAIGHTIDSGQLNADIKLQADNDILNSDVDLTLYQFNLEADSAEAEEKAAAQFGFPLNTSLSLIKDKNGTISLNNSITGDLDSPDFDPARIVAQAVTTGITEAVLSFYTGFGLISLDNGKLSLGGSLKFKPILFEPGNGEMTPEGIADLDKIAELMGERPSVHVTLCAYSNTIDRVMVVARTSNISAEDIELDEDQLAKLDELAQLREATIKDYLAEKKISTSRLIQCKSEHVEGEGLSGVDINI